MASSVEIIINGPGFGDLERNEVILDQMMSVTDRVVALARDTAPHRTGAGAASIDNWLDMGPDGWEVHIGWDEAHQYMASLASHALQNAVAMVAISTLGS